MWLKNLPLKITALGLAVLLWFHVATNRTYDYPREVNLIAGPLPSGFALASPLPERIRLLFTGTGKELLRFMWEDGTTQFLLEPRMAGAIAVSADRLLSHADADVRITQVIEPASIAIFVDTVVTRYAEVRFQGEFGTAADVALVRTPRMEPERVLLSGPQSVLEEFPTVRTRTVDAGVVGADLVRTASLDLSAAYNVVAEPESVRVVFEVAPRTRREISGVAIEIASGWAVEPQEVTLELSGAESVLASIENSGCRASVKVPASTANEGMAVVETTLPPLVELESVNPVRVKVFQR